MLENNVFDYPICCRLLLTIGCGLILHDSWAFHNVIKAAFGEICRQTSGEVNLKSDLDELRIKHARMAARWLTQIHMVILIVLVVIGAVFFENLSLEFFKTLAICVVLHTLLVALKEGKIPITIRSLDLAFIGMMLINVVKLNFADEEAFWILSSWRGVWRLCLAVLYLDVRKVLFWNIMASAASCLRFSRSASIVWNERSGSYLMTSFVVIEVSIVILIGFICCLVRWMLESEASHAAVSKTAQLEAEASHAAVSKILSSLCDAEAHLGPRGDIVNSSPQLQHLLGLACDKSIDGKFFIDHLESDYDRSQFQQLLQGPVNRDIVTALHVNLKHRSSLVTCFHAHLPVIEDGPRHLIGLRETQVMDEQKVFCRPVDCDIIFDAGNPDFQVNSCKTSDNSSVTFAPHSVLAMVPPACRKLVEDWICREVQNVPDDRKYLSSCFLRSLPLIMPQLVVVKKVWLEMHFQDSMLAELPVKLKLHRICPQLLASVPKPRLCPLLRSKLHCVKEAGTESGSQSNEGERVTQPKSSELESSSASIAPSDSASQSGPVRPQNYPKRSSSSCHF